jgi:hypothetical protein
VAWIEKRRNGFIVRDRVGSRKTADYFNTVTEAQRHKRSLEVAKDPRKITVADVYASLGGGGTKFMTPAVAEYGRKLIETADVGEGTRKFLPGQIVRMMQEEGYRHFSMHWHTELWHSLDAKNPAKGWGVEVAGAWYWYSGWVEVVRRHCEENAPDYR